MIIKKEDWEAFGKLRKEELCRCQICGGGFEPGRLCARHLTYKEPFTDKDMLIVCSDCNYRIHLAETSLRKNLKQLNEALRVDLKVHENESEPFVLRPIFKKYVDERARLTAEAIFEVVQLHTIPNRSTLDHFLYSPILDDDDLIRKAKDLGVWNVQAYAPIVKKLREEAARAEKEKRRQEKNNKINK